MNPDRVFRLTLTLAAILAVAPSGSNAQGESEHPVHWTVRPEHVVVRAGDTARVSLDAKIDEFFHLYSTTQGPGGPVRTTVRLLGDTRWSLVGRVRAPAPDTIPDANFGIMTEVHDDSVTLGVTLRANPGVPAFGKTFVGVRYQACTTHYCLPARTDTITVTFELAGEPATSASVEPTVPPERPVADSATETSLPQAAATDVTTLGVTGGIGAFLILAASMGALALLTPCVFPMIPITVTSFLATSDSRHRGVWRAAAYAVGIIGSFTILGVATAVIFGASGLARFSASPIVNLAIAAMFIVFALSLFGVVRLSMPTAVVARLSTVRADRGALGPLLLGAVFTVTAFTCTAPFVGTLLVMSAQGDWHWPLAGMLVFSTVFAVPFFALALVPGLLRHRPRAGEWMPALEMTVGAIELAAAVKFLSNADLVLGWGMLTRTIVIAVWIAILIALVGTLIFARSTPLGRFRLATIALVLALVGTLVPGLFGRRLGELEAFLPPLQTRTTSASGELAWMVNDYAGALAAARREKRPILVDFTGYTCTNCRWMEANMFPRDDVKRALDRFVRVRLYTDGLGEPYLSQQQLEQRLFRTVALPLYAALDENGEPRATFLGMTRDARDFLAFLDRGAMAR